MLDSRQRPRLRTVNLTGIVWAADRDSTGRVSRVAVRPEGPGTRMGDLMVSRSGIGRELAYFVRERINITGVVRKSRSGVPVLCVRSYGFVSQEKLPALVAGQPIPAGRP